MPSRALLLAFIAAATTVAACRADPLAPLSGRAILRDEGDPECVDTVYADSSEASATSGAGAPSAFDGDAENGDEECHTVIIWH